MRANRSACAIIVLGRGAVHRRSYFPRAFAGAGTRFCRPAALCRSCGCEGWGMDALAFLDLKKAPEIQPVYVLAGEQRFLKQLVLSRLESVVLGPGDHEMAKSVYN